MNDEEQTQNIMDFTFESGYVELPFLHEEFLRNEGRLVDCLECITNIKNKCFMLKRQQTMQSGYASMMGGLTQFFSGSILKYQNTLGKSITNDNSMNDADRSNNEVELDNMLLGNSMGKVRGSNILAMPPNFSLSKGSMMPFNLGIPHTIKEEVSSSDGS